MPYSNFHHPYRIDDVTLARAAGFPGNAQLLQLPQLPDNIRMLMVNPTVFTHTYLLLGQQPQRFVNDFSLYLNGVRPFFERADANGGISLPSYANADSRRRLSEDLGACMAAYFMVVVFGLTWESITQIPVNTKLSKKRPDFHGFTATNQRFLFEAKGTTGLHNVVKSLSLAMDQVKNYPEPAEAKIAIVSYLSADDRFFPSTSFVVDPPALPVGFEPDLLTSNQLHFEKVLQFVGLDDTAKEYVSMLSCKLNAKHVSAAGIVPPRITKRLLRQSAQLSAHFSSEKERLGMGSIQVGDATFVGRHVIQDRAPLKAFLGVSEAVLNAGMDFKILEQRIEPTFPI